MRKRKCQICKVPIPEEPEIWIKGRRVCKGCYERFKWKMREANALYNRHNDPTAYNKLLKKGKEF